MDALKIELPRASRVYAVMQAEDAGREREVVLVLGGHRGQLRGDSVLTLLGADGRVRDAVDDDVLLYVSQGELEDGGAEARLADELQWTYEDEDPAPAEKAAAELAARLRSLAAGLDE